MQKPVFIPLCQLLPSKTNPRTVFDDTKLADLAGNLGKMGVLQALLVRPSWCIGCTTQADLDAKRPGNWADTPAERRFALPSRMAEIVDGERRSRAAKIAGITELPCDVREMVDSLVREIQLITFLQKEGLTPLEEARGYDGLLGIKGENGAALHTVPSIAEKVGKSVAYIYQRLKLMNLPETARTALLAGRIGPTVALVIAMIPNKTQRETAAQKILHAHGRDEAMTLVEAQEYVRDHYMQQLKGAPFGQADADWDFTGIEGVPAKPGACTDCKMRTGNNPELFGDVKRGDMCTLPACYRAKCDHVFKRASAKAVEQGAKVLSDKEAESVFLPFGDRTGIRHDCAYVDINEKPMEGLLRAAVDMAKVPTWKGLADGRSVPVVLARDGEGRLRELADRGLLIAAAKLNGEDIFAQGAAGKQPRPNGSEIEAQRAEAARQKREQEIAFAATRALRDKVRAVRWVGLSEFWSAMIDVALAHAGANGTWFLCKRDGLKQVPNKTTEQIVAKHVWALKADGDRAAAAVDLLISAGVRQHGVKDAGFVALAKVYGVDVAAMVKSKEASENAAAGASKKRKKSAGTKAEAAVRGSMPGGKAVAA